MIPKVRFKKVFEIKTHFKKAPIFPVQNSMKINTELLNASNNDSIFSSISAQNIKINDDKVFRGRNNCQSRSFLKQPESQLNAQGSRHHLSMISLNVSGNKPSRKATLDSASFLESSNNTMKSKALEDIMEDPLLEEEGNLIKKQNQGQNPLKNFERTYQIHPSISTFRSDISQLLQAPTICKGDYEPSSYTRNTLIKNETENSILPSFINIKSAILDNKEGNSNQNQKGKGFLASQRNQVNQIPSILLTNQINVSSSSSADRKNAEMFLPMDACGEFEIYLPHNNYNLVVQNLSRTSKILKVKEEIESPSCKN